MLREETSIEVVLSVCLCSAVASPDLHAVLEPLVPQLGEHDGRKGVAVTRQQVVAHAAALVRAHQSRLRKVRAHLRPIETSGNGSLIRSQPLLQQSQCKAAFRTISIYMQPTRGSGLDWVQDRMIRY